MSIFLFIWFICASAFSLLYVFSTLSLYIIVFILYFSFLIFVYACCPALHGTDRAIKQERQQLPKTDPKPVKAVFRTGGRIFRRLDDGWRITWEHQSRVIQCHQPGKQVKIGCHSKPVQDNARPVHTYVSYCYDLLVFQAGKKSVRYHCT